MESSKELKIQKGKDVVSEPLATQIRRDFIIRRSPTHPNRYQIFENDENRLPLPEKEDTTLGSIQASLEAESQGITPYYNRATEKSTMYVQRLTIPPKGPSDEDKKAAMRSRPVRFPLLTVEYPDIGIKYSLIGTDGLMQWFFEPLYSEEMVVDVDATANVPFGTPIGLIRDSNFFSHELAALHWRTVSLHRRLERALFSRTPHNTCQAGNLNCRDHHLVKIIQAFDGIGHTSLKGPGTCHTTHVICENMMLWQVFESLTGVKPKDTMTLAQLRYGNGFNGEVRTGKPFTYAQAKAQKTLNMDFAWGRTADVEVINGSSFNTLFLIPFGSNEQYEEFCKTITKG